MPSAIGTGLHWIFVLPSAVLSLDLNVSLRCCCSCRREVLNLWRRMFFALRTVAPWAQRDARTCVPLIRRHFSMGLIVVSVRALCIISRMTRDELRYGMNPFNQP